MEKIKIKKIILTKGFSTVFVVLGVLNNILKVYQSLTVRKVYFSRWRLRWPRNT